MQRVLIKAVQLVARGLSEGALKCCYNILRNGISTGVLAIFLLVHSLPASALMIGASKVSSYIGEPLKVEIPISNFSSSDNINIQVNLDDSSSETEKTLTATLVSTGIKSNAIIEVRTKKAINEPYLVFSLKLFDGTYQAVKDFTVLLDLRSAGTDIAKALPVAVSLSKQSVDSSDSVMGPYDWAEANNVPKQFGAVIEGQSLWRVARRINKALGVSVEQMMLALYDANPDSFYTTSVDSLKVGSYLTIPDKATVKLTSTSQAKVRLNTLSQPNASPDVNLNADTPAPVSILDEALVSEPVESVLLEEQTNQDADILIDDAADNAKSSADRNTVDETEESFKVDSSADTSMSILVGTVDSLVKELIIKDQRIDFLEQKLKTYEQLALLDEESSNGAPNLLEFESNNVALIEAPIVDGSNVGQNVDVTKQNENQIKEKNDKQARFRLFIVILGVLTVLLLNRKYIFELWNKVTSSKDDSDPIVFSHTQDLDNEQVDKEEREISSYEKLESMYLSEPDGSCFDLKKQEKDAEPKATSDEDVDFVYSMADDIEVDSVLYDVSYDSMNVEYLDAANETEMEIEDRFSFHMANKDFAFLEKLLSAFKEEGLSQETFDYLKLKLLKESHQDEEFISFLKGVEDRMKSYSDETKNKIDDLSHSK